MEKNKYIYLYKAPEVLIAETAAEDVFCTSGSHEGITLEDWYWMEYSLKKSGRF